MKRKTIALLTAVMLSIGLLLAGTYAWFYSTDEAPNEFRLANLGAKITEVYLPEPIVPGATVQKDVTISNTSNISILVRVKFEDILQMLQPDAAGPKEFANGSPGAHDTYDTVLKAAPDFIANVKLASSGWEDVSGQLNVSGTIGGSSYTLKVFRRTARVANAYTKYTYFAYVESTDPEINGQLASLGDDADIRHLTNGDIDPASVTVTYLVNRWDTAGWITSIGGTLVPRPYGMPFNNTGIVEANQGARAGSLPYYARDYIQIIFGSEVEFNPTGALPRNKWFYNSGDGYFYFNGLVAPGGKTPSLITDVSFNVNMGNIFQGSMYTLTPYLEAIQPTAAALTSTAGGGWGLSNISLAYVLLAARCAEYVAP